MLSPLRRALPLAAAALATGCGGAEPTPTTSDAVAETQAATTGTPASASPAKQDAPVDASAVPTDCQSDGKLCLPPAAFVKKLCSAVHQDVALAFFKKGAPFTRGYLAGNTEAWNASGGPSSAEKLVFDEEVIVLLARENKTGIQVSGASGGYDVLRWDGTCATLSGEELTFRVPPKPIAPKLLWKDLPEGIQNKLLEDATIAKLNKERRDECKGATIGDVSVKCVKAVDKLSLAIIAYVRDGRDFPAPTKLD
jgi:hypothetical protein